MSSLFGDPEDEGLAAPEREASGSGTPAPTRRPFSSTVFTSSATPHKRG